MNSKYILFRFNFYSKMGNSPNNSVTSKNFNPQDWQVTDRSGSEQSATGTFKILKNIHTSQCIDEYELMWPSQQDFKFYLDSYNWRKHQPHIVNSLYLVQNHHSQMCSKSYMAKIYIEHIYTRLSDIKDIPHPDNLYVILSMLEGYQKLYQNLHYFKIQEDQVCIDMQGTVKVWVNSDLSKNYPEGSQFPGEFRNKDQSQMVDEIISIVGQNTDHEFQPQSFQEFYFNKKGKKQLGFQEAKLIVNEYAKNHQTKIPNKFQSILQMMNGDNSNSENEQGTSTKNDHEEHYNNHQLNNQNNNFTNVSNYHNLPVSGATHMPFNQNQQNYVSVPQSGLNSPSHIYPNIQNQSFQTFYRPPQVNAHLYPIKSVAQPINQFIPKIYQPLNRPVISIPAPRGVSFSPNSHIIPTQIISNYPSKTLIPQAHYINSNLTDKNAQQSKHSKNREQYQHESLEHQEDFEIQGLSNNRQYNQIVSKLNNPDQDHSQQHHQSYREQRNTNENQDYYDYMNDGNQQYDQYPSNHRTNEFAQENQQNNVSRSLQINNQNTYNWSGNQNSNSKSHITNDRNGNLLGSGQKLGSLGSVNNSVKIRSQKRSSTLANDLKYYYTLDQQLQLDDEIAADLQKYIHAM